MKLTDYIRQAFVKAAMDDVPKIDYEQQCRDLLNKKRLAILKPLGLDKAAPNRLTKTMVYMKGSMPNMYAQGLLYVESIKLEADEDIRGLCDLHEAQRNARQHLENKLEGIAAGCTTRKQLVELLPEFEKYLPAEEAKPGANLPAISNLVGDFVRAGWPKNKKQATTFG